MFCSVCGSRDIKYLEKPEDIPDLYINDVKCNRCGEINTIKYSSFKDCKEVEYVYLERMNYEMEVDNYLNPVLEQ